MERQGLGPQHVDTYHVQRYLNRTFVTAQGAIDVDNRRRNGTEVARFAKYVLGKQIDLLKFNKRRGGEARTVPQMAAEDFEQVRAFQRATVSSAFPNAASKQANQLKELFENKYKPALEMIIQTGCRPSEALYAANFRSLWSSPKKTPMILRLPAALSKTGFEHSWTFD